MNEPEDRIIIETRGRYYGRPAVGEPAVTFETLFLVMMELYTKANEIGWETKVLDPLSEWLRKLREKT